MNKTIQVGGMDFDVRRSARRKTVALMVGRTGELAAYAPMETSTEALSSWISTKLLWAHGKLALKKETAPKSVEPEFVSGESFCYLGRRYRVKIVQNQDQPLVFDGTRFLLRRGSKSPEKLFQQWYAETGSEWLRRRIERLSRLTASKPSEVAVRDLGFRWGSCGRNGVLFFNWKIFQLPVRLVDYVVLHELVHLRERSHGTAFKAALERALPDWKEREEDLGKKARDYLAFDVMNPNIKNRTLVFH